jgi:hypothetical protein
VTTERFNKDSPNYQRLYRYCKDYVSVYNNEYAKRASAAVLINYLSDATTSALYLGMKFDKSSTTHNRISSIKYIREYTEMGLRDAKDLMDKVFVADGEEVWVNLNVIQINQFTAKMYSVGYIVLDPTPVSAEEMAAARDRLESNLDFLQERQ